MKPLLSGRPRQVLFSLVLAIMPFYFAGTANALDLSSGMSSVDLSGTTRLRYEDIQWYDTANFTRTSFFSLRVRPTLAIGVDEGVKIVMTPQFAKILGRDYSYTLTDSSGSIGYNEAFHMHEAYVKWGADDGLSVTAGRMILSYGDQVIIAAGEWPLYGRAFDGAKLQYKTDFMDADLLGLKIDSSLNLSGNDRDLAGIYTKWNLLDDLKAFEIYGFHEADQTGGKNEARHVYGVRMKYVSELSEDHVLDFGLEWASGAGSAGFGMTSDEQSMLVASAGYEMRDFYGLRLGLEYNRADKDWKEWYPLTKTPLGRTELLGRPNLQASALKISFVPVEDMTVRLDYWLYERVDNKTPAYRPTGSAAGAGAGSDSRELGQAIDLALSFKASKKIEYGIGATVFNPGAYFADQFSDRVPTDFYAVTNISF